MPLSPGKLVGYDDARRMFIFTMLNGAETVQFEISCSAMDDLAGGVTAEPLTLREVTICNPYGSPRVGFY